MGKPLPPRARLAAVAAGVLVAAAVAVVGTTAVSTTDDSTHAEAASSSAPTPYEEQMETYISDGSLRLDEIRQIGYDMCPIALSIGDCSDYTVEVADLDGPVGRTQVHVAEGSAASEGPEVTVTGIQLDASLAQKSPQYVAFVASHEWNHVEQVLRAPTAATRAQMSQRADELFGGRSGAVPSGDGREVLTDCMTALGDGVDTGTGGVPYYIQSRMQESDVEVACQGWQGALEGGSEGAVPWWQVWAR